MPNAFDRYMKNKTGASGILPPMVDDVGLPAEAGMWRKIPSAAIGRGLSPMQAFRLEQQRLAIDPAQLRERMILTAETADKMNNAGIGPYYGGGNKKALLQKTQGIGVGPGFATWEEGLRNALKKIGPKGLMSLLSPVGIVEGSVLNSVLPEISDDPNVTYQGPAI